MNPDLLTRRVFKPLVFLLCLLPAAWLAAGVLGWPGAPLGANPIEKIQDTLGIWGLRFLLLTLAVTPLREIGGWPRLHGFRRMLGLYAFFYVSSHFLFYLFVDQGINWRSWLEDIAKRPFITAGFTAFLLLLPLALTSTRRAMRRLGRRWQRLHRLVYVAGTLGCVHFWWQVKADIREPLVYAAILALLFGWRLWRARDRARKSALAESAVAARAARGEQDTRENQDAPRRGPPADPLLQ